MATLKPELRRILQSFDLDPRECLWDCHGTWVIYHKYCEVIAAKAGITFDPPMPLETNGAGKSVALCVVGRMGDRVEWSTGEASEHNYRTGPKQAAYPYAMAEKRAKDRVILKLVGLSAFVYSEDEADEFKDTKPAENGATPAPAPQTAPEPSDWETLYYDLLRGAEREQSVVAVNEYLKVNKADIRRLEAGAPDLHKALQDRVIKHRANLAQKPAA